MTSCWFDYKTVIVTGASSGIGKELVKRLIHDHCCNIIGVARNEEKIKALIEELGDRSGYFSYCLFDVAVEENWENFAKQLKKDGIRPDILINNAGVLPKFDKFLHYTQEDINNSMNTNFYSSVYSMHCMLPMLLRSPAAAVINISSAAALCSLAGTSVYSASKAALKSLTDSIREEYRGRCYFGLVCPGFTKTNIFSNQTSIEKDSTSERALRLVSTSCEKMVDKIINGMWKKKSDMVFGMDARMMSGGNKLFGVKVSKVSSAVMRISKLELFADVFSEYEYEFDDE